MTSIDHSSTSAIDATLLTLLSQLSREHAETAARLNHLPIDDPLAIAWRKYVAAERAWIFERKSGENGCAGGMSVMLCIPREPAGCLDVSVGDPGWVERIDAFGVPILADGVTSLTIHYFSAVMRAAGCAHLSGSPNLLMSHPMMLPAWSIYPPNGYRRGWRSLISNSATQADTLWKRMMQLFAPRLARFESAIVANCMDHPLYENVVGGFYWALRNLEKALAQSMVDRFVSHLNPLVVASCLTRYQALYPQEYNWIVGGATKQARERRADALEVFPAISESSVDPFLASVTPEQVRTSSKLRKTEWFGHFAAISGAVAFGQLVDQGLPLIKGLAQAVGVRPVAIKALRRVSNRTIELFGEPPLGWEDIFRAIDNIAPERHPKHIREWSSFSALYLECVRVYRAMSVLHGPMARKFMEGAARSWLADFSHNWQRSEVCWRDGMRGLENLQDAMEVAFELRDLVAELGLSSSERCKAYSIFSRMSPQDWRVHVQTLGRSEELNSSKWHEVLSSVSIDGVSVRALNSSNALHDEGALMHHCIYTYRERLQREQLLAFAIGGDRTSDRSTVLLKYQQTPDSHWRVSVVAHHAAFNHAPSSVSHAVAKRLCDELSSKYYFDALTVVNLHRVRRCPTARSSSTTIRGVRISAHGIPGLRRIDSENRATLRSNLLDLIATSDLI